MVDRILLNPLIGPIWYSILCGIIIGIEREIKRKDAGVRTNVIICIGAAIYTYISTHVTGGDVDSSRVIAQIVSGIGFIGGGVIIFDKDKVQGLTSAAIIWMVAAIGILNGLGMYFEAVMASLTVVISDFILGKAKRLLRKNDDAGGSDDD